MRKTSLVLIAYYLFFAFFTSALSAEESKDISKYFPMDIGNKWRYQKSGMKRGSALEITDNLTIISKETLDGREIFPIIQEDGKYPVYCYGADEGSVSIYKIITKYGYQILIPPMPYIPTDIQFNKTIKDTVTIKNYDQNGNLKSEEEAKYEVQFEGFEDVTVPAGDFKKCLEIIFSYTTSQQYSVERIWFAQNVGMIQSNLEVISFDEKIPDLKIDSKLEGAIIKERTIGTF